jgi:hypothetical protein
MSETSQARARARGGGKSKLLPARAGGAGKDAETLRAEQEAEAIARSPWVAELLCSEQELGRALLALAGGPDFVRGRGVKLTGAGMAARAGRAVQERRGVRPSDTSLDDGAAAAALALVRAVAEWEYACGVELTAAGASAPDCRKFLAGRAWRAAFKDIANAESTLSGGNGHWDRDSDGIPIALTAGQLEVQRESLESWARREPYRDSNAWLDARRSVSSWVWRSIVPYDRARGAKLKAADNARQRARFLIRLVHGASWADAARLSRFADGAAAAKSLAREHTWATLARAQVESHPMLARLRRQWMRAARAEVKARRAARTWLRTSAPRGARRAAGRRNVGPLLPGGGQLVRSVRSSVAPRVSRRIRSLAVDIAATARRAIDAREAAARATALAALRLQDFTADAAKQWESASRGLRRGYLRG